MRDTEEFSSWLESRRLIIAQLAAMDTSIHELSSKIDHFHELTRERVIEVARELQVGNSDLKLRVAMLELRAKIWGGLIGLLAGGVSTVVVDIVTRGLHR